MNPLNRRGFLHLTAGVTSGAALAPALWTSGVQSAEPAVNASPLRVAVMGLGGRGRDLAGRFGKMPGVSVLAVCDPDASRRMIAAAELAQSTGQAPRAEADVRRLLDDQSLDILVCAAPNHWHGPATLLACQAGKHVYVEKPCCHNPAEGEAMIALAARQGLCVQTGTQRRSAPAIQEGIARIHAGAIGRAYFGRCWYANVRGPLPPGQAGDPPAGLDYDLWQGPAPRRPFRSNFLHYHWHWFWHWGNGELGNNGTHSIDLARWALGVEFPSRVLSAGGRYAWDDEQETPDTQTVTFEFPDKKLLVWEGRSCNRGIGEGFGVTVHGTEGTIAIDSGGFTQFDPAGKQVERQAGRGPGDGEHIANFLAAVRTNDPARLNAGVEIGHRTTLLPHLGNIAHRTGSAIDCDTATGRPRDNKAAMALWGREYAPGWEPPVG